MGGPMDLNQDTIRRLAYSLWEAGGKRDDSREKESKRAMHARISLAGRRPVNGARSWRFARPVTIV